MNSHITHSSSILCILWMRFGPYHLARLNGAARRLKDHNIRVVGLEVAALDHYDWAETGGAEGFERVTIFPKTNYNDLKSKDIARGVAQTLNEILPNAVAINGWSVPEAAAALAWCSKHDRTAILMSETKQDECTRNPLKEWLKARRVRQFDAAVVGGQPHKDYAFRLGLPVDKVFPGYNAVDNDYFAAAGLRVQTAAGLKDADLTPGFIDEHVPRLDGELSELIDSLKKFTPYFYANTRFLARKNIDGLLRAYADYRSRSENPWQLVVTGDGPERERLHDLCRELELSPYARFPGFVQYHELPAYYALASAFVHPAKSEPWGLVVNEACATGLPVLVSKTVGAAYELVENGLNGFLCDPADDSDIMKGMLKLTVASRQQRLNMGAKSRRLVEKYAPEKFGEALLKAMLEC